MKRRIKVDIIGVLVIAIILCCIIIRFSIKNSADASFEEPVIVKTEDNTVIYEYKENTVNLLAGGENSYSPYGYTIVIEDDVLKISKGQSCICI